VTTRRMGAFLLWALTSGCAHWDVGEPAPGFVDISAPPEIVGQRHVIPAKQAGEKVLLVNSGIFVSTGIRAGQAGLSTWSTWGGEVTVHWGENDDNHGDHLGREPEVVFPKQSWALTLGGSPRSLANALSATRGTDIYLEVQKTSDLIGLAAGPVWNPTAGRVGAQVTAFAGLGFLRATVLDRDATLQIGVMAKFPFAWVWPR
jgi:hypothetical protein